MLPSRLTTPAATRKTADQTEHADHGGRDRQADQMNALLQLIAAQHHPHDRAHHEQNRQRRQHCQPDLQQLTLNARHQRPQQQHEQ
jgi:hypothetical protein